MTPINYFKSQAKKLFKDYQTKAICIDDLLDNPFYKYDPKFFDINSILLDFDTNEETFSLMKAQHIIARMVGFLKWTDLLEASKAELELAKLLFDNQNKISLEDWKMYIFGVECDNKITLDSESKLEIFKHIFLKEDDFENPFSDYRLDKDLVDVNEKKEYKEMSNTHADIQITSLPLGNLDRKEFIEAANQVFEDIIETIEPRNLKLTRQLWDAELYIDNLLREEMLPIDKDYALSLIDAFLVHEVIGLAVKADEISESPIQ